LDGVEPRALGGQGARYDSYPTASVLNFPVMGGDPASDLSALMPACVVPDKKQGLFAPRLEPLAAVPEEPRGYGAYRASIHEPKPRLFELRHIQPVAGEGLRLGVVLFHLFLDQANRSPRIGPGVQRGTLQTGEPGLILEPKNPLRVALGQPDQPVASPFFRAYSGSGLSIQRLARSQRPPSRAR